MRQMENLNNINILIGPNGSGKSNIIHALYLLKALELSEYDSHVVKDNVFDNETNYGIFIELSLIIFDQERAGMFERFLTMNRALKGLDLKSNFLKMLKYSIRLHGATIVEEKLSISNNSNGFVDLIFHSIDGDKGKQAIIVSI